MRLLHISDLHTGASDDPVFAAQMAMALDMFKFRFTSDYQDETAAKRAYEAHNAEVRAEVEGIIEEIVHDEGDVVNAGDLIARLSDRDYRAEVEKIKAEIAEKDAKLKMLQRGARAEEIELARTTVAKGEERGNRAEQQKPNTCSVHKSPFERVREFSWH